MRRSDAAAAPRVLHVRALSPTAYVLRFERNGLHFEPGQYINVGLEGGDVREYSIWKPTTLPATYPA